MDANHNQNRPIRSPRSAGTDLGTVGQGEYTILPSGEV